jgi:DnaJ family protein B protein 12
MHVAAVVSRAFQVLSDPDKKSKYDKFGGDPDSRFTPSAGPSGASPFGGFGGGGFPRSAGAGGPMFEEEISPEELFNRFFNGGFGGGGFGPFGGPQFVFNMGGGPGFRVHQFGGPRPRRRPREASAQAEPAPSGWATFQSLLPLILLFVLPLLSSLFSGSSSPSGPSYRFDAAVPPHTMQRTTPKYSINYFVNPRDVEDYSAKKLRQLDTKVEVDYITKLRYECESEVHARDRMMQEAQGWFFPDVEKMKEARSMELKSCRRLDSLKGRY